MLDQVIDAIMSRCDAADLMRAHIALALVGGLLAIYVANLTSFERDDHGEPAFLQWSRRVGYFVTAIALFWSVIYMDNHRWQPWPPMLLLMLGVVVMLAARARAIRLRVKRERAAPSPTIAPFHQAKHPGKFTLPL
jgi:cell division protein FtsW (lipid II flippase)